jgi:signal transduction histidine kinase
MRRLLPHSLFGQMLLILLVGLALSDGIGAWIYFSDREAAVREVGGLTTAQRIANLARLVEDVSADWRSRIVAAASDPTFQVALSTQKPDLVEEESEGPVAEAIRAYLIDRLALAPARRPLVVASEAFEPPFGPGRLGGHGPMMMRMQAGLLGLDVAIPLSMGQWLSFRTALPRTANVFSLQFIVSMAVMAVVLIGVAIWAARRVTAPLAALAAAAQRLGQDVNAPPMAEIGTVETRQASRAFNEMQVRLRELIDNRTRLLAAVSHDLRTPLTLLRLRAENVADAEERDRMLATIAEMDTMVGSTLQYAREDMAAEPVRTTDLAALVQSIVDDMADAGFDVAMEPAAPILRECRPSALKRAVRNLVDNAVRYGKSARVAIRDEAKSIDITLDDAGPGLPAEELARVFQPFYRVEGSRSRETGGVGLGLAIARSLVERHGGTLTLTNRPAGGLCAQIRLPK